MRCRGWGTPNTTPGEYLDLDFSLICDRGAYDNGCKSPWMPVMKHLIQRVRLPNPLPCSPRGTVSLPDEVRVGLYQVEESRVSNFTRASSGFALKANVILSQ